MTYSRKSRIFSYYYNINHGSERSKLSESTSDEIGVAPRRVATPRVAEAKAARRAEEAAAHWLGIEAAVRESRDPERWAQEAGEVIDRLARQRQAARQEEADRMAEPEAKRSAAEAARQRREATTHFV